MHLYMPMQTTLFFAVRNNLVSENAKKKKWVFSEGGGFEEGNSLDISERSICRSPDVRVQKVTDLDPYILKIILLQASCSEKIQAHWIHTSFRGGTTEGLLCLCNTVGPAYLWTCNLWRARCDSPPGKLWSQAGPPQIQLPVELHNHRRSWKGLLYLFYFPIYMSQNLEGVR